ncbi:MAG: hypothetical protein NXH75_09010 [Halobacteriovoraceae bacterium]|nr:hypothetical protein [Halobacteriovoraceae bacterium]
MLIDLQNLIGLRPDKPSLSFVPIFEDKEKAVHEIKEGLELQVSDLGLGVLKLAPAFEDKAFLGAVYMDVIIKKEGSADAILDPNFITNLPLFENDVKEGVYTAKVYVGSDRDQDRYFSFFNKNAKFDFPNVGNSPSVPPERSNISITFQNIGKKCPEIDNFNYYNETVNHCFPCDPKDLNANCTFIPIPQEADSLEYGWEKSEENNTATLYVKIGTNTQEDEDGIAIQIDKAKSEFNVLGGGYTTYTTLKNGDDPNFHVENGKLFVYGFEFQIP